MVDAKRQAIVDSWPADVDRKCDQPTGHAGQHSHTSDTPRWDGGVDKVTWA